MEKYNVSYSFAEKSFGSWNARINKWENNRLVLKMLKLGVTFFNLINCPVADV